MSSRGWLLLAGVGLVAATALAAVRELRPGYARYAGQAQPVRLVPSLTGKPEYCLTCHQGIEQVSAAHPVETFGCVRCHGGNGLALDAQAAHQGLLGGRNPSDYSVVELACGGTDCHSGDPAQNRDHIARSLTSIQASYAGAIAAVRYAFGAQPDPTARYATRAIEDPTITTSTGLAALADFANIVGQDPEPVQKFAANCLLCHLWAQPQPGGGYQRLSGCAACHSPSNWDGTYTGSDPTLRKNDKGHASVHRLTTAIPYTQCNTCHNRGNYSLVDMAFHPRQDLPADGQASRLEGYYQPIAQFAVCEYELDCVDCHTSQEAMGDGDLHSNKKEVQYVRCYTCHGTLNSRPKTRAITDPNDLALRRAFLDPVVPLKLGDTILITDKGEPLWNVSQRPDGGFTLVGKVTGHNYDIPQVQGSGCKQNPDQQDSRYCHACHAIQRP
jgi:hypothetical protein